MFRAFKKAIKNKKKRKTKKLKSISLFNCPKLIIRPVQSDNLLTIFPVEMLLHILSFLSANALKAVSETSCLLYILSRDSGLVNLMVRKRNQENLCKIPAACEASELSCFSDQMNLGVNNHSVLLTLIKEREGKQFFFIEFLENNFNYILSLGFENISKKSRVQASYIALECAKKHKDQQALIKTLEIPFSSKEIELRLKEYIQQDKLTLGDNENPISWLQQFLLSKTVDESSTADTRIRLYIQEIFNEFKLDTDFEVNAISAYRLPAYFNRR